MKKDERTITTYSRTKAQELYFLLETIVKDVQRYHEDENGIMPNNEYFAGEWVELSKEFLGKLAIKHMIEEDERNL